MSRVVAALLKHFERAIFAIWSICLALSLHFLVNMIISRATLRFSLHFAV